MGLLICAADAATAKPEDFISDQGWEMICTRLDLMGKMIPSRELTTLLFRDPS